MARNIIVNVLWLLICLALAGCQFGSNPTSAPATAALPAATLARTDVATAAATDVLVLPTATLPPRATIGPATPVAPERQFGTYTDGLRPEARSGLDLAGLTEYHLAVRVDDKLSRLDGDALIRYTNREGVDLNRIYLHLFPNLWGAGMAVSDVKVDGRTVASKTEEDGALLDVSLPASLGPGRAVDLSMGFSVPIPSGTDIGNYGEFAYDDGILALAGFYPTVAVYDEKGWRLEKPAPQGDVIFADASLYDVTFTAPSDLVVVATGEESEAKTQKDGLAIWRLAGGPMRDFNIAASSRFEVTTGDVDGVRVNSYYTPEHLDGGRQALRWASTALSLFNSKFGPYPYRELDVVETPTSAGGIEYPGMVVVAANLYANATRWDFFESATAHEVGHQWWYNVVGNDQINDPWLDESLTQYSTYLYFRDSYGAAGEQGFRDSLVGRQDRAKEEDQPIGLPVAGYSGGDYSAIVYGRGALFFIEVEKTIGQQKMIEFLREYYRRFQWKIARPQDLEQLLEEVSGQDLSPLFEKWVYPRTM